MLWEHHRALAKRRFELLHFIGMEHGEGCPITIVRLFELGDQASEPPSELSADHAHFGRRTGLLRAREDDGLHLEQSVVNLVVSQRRHVGRGIARRLKDRAPNGVPYPVAIGRIEIVDLFCCHQDLARAPLRPAQEQQFSRAAPLAAARGPPRLVKTVADTSGRAVVVATIVASVRSISEAPPSIS
jgi:hypothetical protein